MVAGVVRTVASRRRCRARGQSRPTDAACDAATEKAFGLPVPRLSGVVGGGTAQMPQCVE